MARYEHLKVFKEAYDLLVYFYKISRGFPKEVKYGLALEIHNKTSTLISLIVANNNQTDKRLFAEILMLLEDIKIKVRLLKDLNIISQKRYEHLSKKLVSISKQTVAWQKWSQSDTS